MIDYYRINEQNQETVSLKGKGEKQLLLYISDHSSEFIYGKLEEIMNAIKYKLNDDCYYAFNANGNQLFGSILNDLKVKDIIVFDDNLHMNNFNMDFTPYIPVTLEDKRIVIVEPLTIILNDKNKKFKFWQLLQKMFLKQVI